MRVSIEWPVTRHSRVRAAAGAVDNNEEEGGDVIAIDTAAALDLAVRQAVAQATANSVQLSGAAYRHLLETCAALGAPDMATDVLCVLLPRPPASTKSERCHVANGCLAIEGDASPCWMPVFSPV